MIYTKIPRRLKKHLKTTRAKFIYPNVRLKDIRIIEFDSILRLFKHEVSGESPTSAKQDNSSIE